ncbi:MAG: nucleotidyltransferase family protein [Myxococcaceae bacterium]|nr:nucleotidyltransferase family protein [Myxococcaceae bacterium]
MAPPSLVDTFRVLSSLAPERVSLAGAPWEEYVDWAIAQGLAPLASYNLEYRLTGGGAPQWARDRLLSVYQGSLNDNVMKLVHFKRTVDDLEGRKLLLIGGAAFAEALYPHVAFRPVLELQLLMRRMDVEPFAGFLAQAGFKPEAGEEDWGAQKVLNDGRTPILLYADVLGPQAAEETRGIFERARPMPVYGPSMFRPDLEDAILLVVLEQARQGYDVPYLSFVDLRELMLGAPTMGGAYSRAVDTQVLRDRARAWRLERALFASLSIVERLFPETSTVVRPALPELRGATRQLLERLVVTPLSQLGRMKRLRGADRLRRLLTGGR